MGKVVYVNSEELKKMQMLEEIENELADIDVELEKLAEEKKGLLVKKEKFANNPKMLEEINLRMSDIAVDKGDYNARKKVLLERKERLTNPDFGKNTDGMGMA